MTMGRHALVSGMDVFVYGTLTDRERAGAVLDEVAYRGPAVLSGLHRVDGAYPTLAPGGTVDGRILSTDDVAALDRYEGVADGLYVRVSVPLADADSGDLDARVSASPADASRDAAENDARGRTVETYVGDPDRLDAPVDWPGDGLFPDRVRSYLADADVVVRPRSGRAPSPGGEAPDGPAGTDADGDRDTR